MQRVHIHISPVSGPPNSHPTPYLSGVELHSHHCREMSARAFSNRINKSELHIAMYSHLVIDGAKLW